MADPRPADDSMPARPSLFDRALRAARPVPRAPVQPKAGERLPVDRASVALAILIVATPLATLAGATWRTGQVRAETAALAQRSTAAVAAQSDRDRARALLSAAWNAPTLGATIEAIARALPEDAALLRVERNANPLTIEIAAPDPDRALAALRRDPALGGLRAVAQARAEDDGRMRVTLEQTR